MNFPSRIIFHTTMTKPLSKFIFFILLLLHYTIVHSSSAATFVVPFNERNNIHGSRRQIHVRSSSSSRTQSPEQFGKEEQLVAGAVTTGDTRGATLLLSDVCISAGPNQILQSVNLRVDPKERWGIVGPNGAGKSTLLGAITGTSSSSAVMDRGEALVAPKVRVGYLRQTAVSGSTRTVREEAASEMAEINAARRQLQVLEQRLSSEDSPDDSPGDPSGKLLDEYKRAQDRFEAVGGYAQEQQVDAVLKGLGFQPADSERPCSDFSGGWQMRIALARLLLSKPDLLLLDEPSNHLDSSARDWLAHYLASYDGAILLVSHDTALLSRSVNSIAEIAGRTLLHYVSCTYDQYLAQKQFRADSAAAEYQRNLKEAQRLQQFVDKFGASATKAASAQSRVKMIERMKKEGKLDAPPQALLDKRWKPALDLPDAPKSIGEDLLTLEGADVGHDQVILKDIDLVIRRGMKLILRGPNGAGKSTLLATLRGKLPLLAGKRNENEKLRLGVFTQDLAQELDAHSRAIDLVTSHAREGPHGDITVSDHTARSVMGKLGLGDDKPLRRIGELSGGEKARVALSMFALKASNLLLLDEPSNHLDIECIEALGQSLSSWGGKDGAIVIISHDRQFCESIGSFTHVGTVQHGTLVMEQRGLEDRDWAQYDISYSDTGSVIDGTATGVNAAVELTAEEKAERDKKRKMAFNAPKRIKKIEELIEKSEMKIVEYEEEMMKYGNDVEKLMDLTTKKNEQDETIAQLMEEWEQLEEVMMEMNG